MTNRRSPNCITVGDEVLIDGVLSGEIVACPTQDETEYEVKLRDGTVIAVDGPRIRYE